MSVRPEDKGSLTTKGRTQRRRALGMLATCLMASGALHDVAMAHGLRAGDLLIDHPYALPSAPQAREGTAHLRALRNTGRTADRLLGARTAVAERVLLRRRAAPAQALEAIELPPAGEARMRHDGDYELALVGLRQVLRDGDRFKLTLRFERAGEREVTVWVQQPRDTAGAPAHTR